MKPNLPALPLTLCLLVSSSCGGSDNNNKVTEPVDDPPTVTLVSPSLAGGNVGLLQEITVTFSEPMSPTTLNATTVTVSPMEGNLHLSYDEAGRSLWIAPDSMYPVAANLTLSISSGATDMAGNGLEPFSQAFSTASMSCVAVEDHLEPNDVVASATEVEPGVLMERLSACGGNKDYYKVTLSEPAKLISHSYVTFADNLSWFQHWMREDGAYFGTTNTLAKTGRDIGFRHTFLPGTYFVEIYTNTEADMGLYDFFIESAPPCPDDSYEDNDFSDEPASVNPGTLQDLKACYLDADWFSVPMLAGQTLTATLELGEWEGTRRLHIRVPGGLNDTESGFGGSLSLELTATQDGTALVNTMLWEDDVTYDLVIQVSDP